MIEGYMMHFVFFIFALFFYESRVWYRVHWITIPVFTLDGWGYQEVGFQFWVLLMWAFLYWLGYGKEDVNGKKVTEA